MQKTGGGAGVGWCRWRDTGDMGECGHKVQDSNLKVSQSWEGKAW